MTESEGRALARTACLLLLAAAVRWGMAARAGPAVVPADSALALTGLLEESRRERDEAARRQEPLAEGERLDPNRANDVELDRLPGVGAATALAIVAAREQKGPFRQVEELLDVPGIGPATLRKMQPHLYFSGGYPVGRPVTRDPGPVLALNRASIEELDGLPGIGPALAQRILDERDRLGGFSTLDDLLAVRGIGKSTLERLQPLVTVP
jgi:competence ComEA-like helix-hairpin-helix protein